MTLHPYQEECVKILLAKKRWGLFSDAGTGKTAMAIRAADQTTGPILVITTKSLVYNWHKEIDMWSSDPSRFTVTWKDRFRRTFDTVPRHNVFIYDEAHTGSMYTSKIHKACIAYIKKHNPEYIWPLTATPILSKVWSVWGLARMVGNTHFSWRAFQAKFFSMVNMGYRLVPVQKFHIEKDIAVYLHSFGTVLSKDTVLDLPDTEHVFEYFTLNTHQKRAIRALEDDPQTINNIVRYTKELQIGSGTLAPDTIIPCDKRDRVLELIEQNPKTVIVCRHTLELEALHAIIPNSAIFNGKTSIENREKIIAEANEGKCIMLLQSDMGVGFNLTGISTMVFYSHTFDYVAYYQSLARIHRIGQKNRCLYIHLITDETIDAEVWGALSRKSNFDIELYARSTAVTS